jgi:aminoglycoside phosphotransferase (APT) family kinase protein
MREQLDVSDLLDRATLAADSRWPGASVLDLVPLQGGVSSLTFAARLERGREPDRRIVVKVAPPGLAPVRNRDVLRQARVMRALHGVDGVRVPEVLLEDAGTPPFFVMDFVEGESYEPKLSVAASPPAPDVVVDRARAAVQMLARMQLVAPDAVGLGDEPVMPVVEELDRWQRLYATVPEELHFAQAELHRRLAESVPDPLEPRILHGDYRIGNMQFAGPELGAIIDWEIWSVGDPRHDLAWLLTWVDPVQVFFTERSAADEQAGHAMPSAGELLADYLAIRPGDLPDLAWFEACCRYKMASTTSVLVKQNRRRPDPAPHLEVAATTVEAMIERGLATLDIAAASRR